MTLLSYTHQFGPASLEFASESDSTSRVGTEICTVTATTKMTTSASLSTAIDYAILLRAVGVI